LIFQDSGIGYVVDPSIADRPWMGELKNVSIGEALELILTPLTLDFTMRGSTVTVFEPRR